MAGDWIPWVKGLTRRPEVLRIAAATGLTRREVAATLMEIWEWFDAETEDGFMPGIDVPTLSHLVGDICPDFVPMMSRVGWLSVGTDGIRVPNFDRWMGRSAKSRLKDAAKKQRNRQGPIPKGTNVPMPEGQMSRSQRDKNGTTEQNRREEKGRRNPSLPSSCPETAETVSRTASQPDRLQPILTFRCDGKTDHWHLTGDHLAKWQQAYPSLDILAECRKALAWIEANPERRKTASGMPRFLVNWLNRSQNRRPSQAARPQEDGVKGDLFDELGEDL